MKSRNVKQLNLANTLPWTKLQGSFKMAFSLGYCHQADLTDHSDFEINPDFAISQRPNKCSLQNCI